MRPRAMLLTIRRDNREMEELVYSLGYDLGATILQARSKPDPDLHLGRGKLESARDELRRLGLRHVVVNAALKPGQIYNLVRFFGEGAEEEVEVYDRTRVILEIFSERARSPEARLQVELARLQWEMPLVKEVIRQAKRGERAGFLGGGEYEVNQYYDMIKRRIVKARDELERIRRERDVRRKHRRRGGFHLVSLAGYTNAGKSSLLTAISGERTLVENRYFSTLGTKTRRARSERREILVTDTVGFIEDLPPWLVEAFHSTLEEIALADLILLTVDVSDPLEEIRRKLKSSLRVLWEFQTPRGTPDLRRPPTPILVVFNKADAVPAEEALASILALEEDGLIDERRAVVSARTGTGVAELLEGIVESLPGYARVVLRLPAGETSESVVSGLHRDTDVLAFERLDDGGTRLDVEVRYEALANVLRAVDSAGGSWQRHEEDRAAWTLPDALPEVGEGLE